YTVAAARPAIRRKVPWIHFSWGTDIELFGKSPGQASLHLPLIREAFARCDFHIADTRRDLDEAVNLGFRGTTLGPMVANGGFDIDELRALRSTPAARDTILVKGRQGGYVGKALNILRAIRLRPDSFRRFRIRIFMATADVEAEARALRAATGIDCEALPRLGYRDLLGWYARSIIAVAASDVDGTPGFLLEAMAMGALPVHSDMASIREWIAHGERSEEHTSELQS